MENLKRKNGITLISLVVTIIVLLILAGISIMMLTGENGILKRASEASEVSKTAEKEEKTILSNYEDFINEHTTGKIVEQVTDKKPGVLEGIGTEDNPYVINSIEDLVFFAYDVTNGNNYEGKTVTLGVSLDFNSSKSYVDPFRTDYGKYGYDGELKTLLTTGEGFKPIGNDTTQSFYGTFDGKGNSVNNLYINITNFEETNMKVGLFTNNGGNIYNINLLDVNLYLSNNNGALGGISGQNSMTGNISNCLVSGSIKNESTQGCAGGITCYSSGNIENCANISNILAITNGEKTDCVVGGICTSVGGSTIIQNCYNKGQVEAYGNERNTYVGGILGWCTTGSKINNCYNTGIIYGSSNKICNVGGIAGKSFSEIRNSYSIGEVNITGLGTLKAGMIIGINSGSINSIYYQKINEIVGIGENSVEVESEILRTEEEMKSESFVNLLNQDNADAWKQDTENKNNGYPILSWQ